MTNILKSIEFHNNSISKTPFKLYLNRGMKSVRNDLTHWLSNHNLARPIITYPGISTINLRKEYGILIELIELTIEIMFGELKNHNTVWLNIEVNGKEEKLSIKDMHSLIKLSGEYDTLGNFYYYNYDNLQLRLNEIYDIEGKLYSIAVYMDMLY